MCAHQTQSYMFDVLIMLLGTVKRKSDSSGNGADEDGGGDRKRIKSSEPAEKKEDVIVEEEKKPERLKPYKECMCLRLPCLPHTLPHNYTLP